MTRPPKSTSISDRDRRLMHRALRLARRGEGWVEPDPMVGCVIAHGDRIIGEGYHRRFGTPHAEVEALRSCREDPRGATCYVTLEPCCHFGKTPPCTDALIQAGIGRVVTTMPDPNPLVNGGGSARLIRAGIQVQWGVLVGEAAALLAPFRTFMTRHRPYVIAKWAQSLDGKLATRTGDSRWISCEASRRIVHRLRARVDAVIVGIGTVLADDPQLTARHGALRRRAARVVVDSALRSPERCRLIRTRADGPVLILTSARSAASLKAKRLRARGIDVQAVPKSNRGLSLRRALELLVRREMTNVLLEGGPTLLTSAFEAGLVDEAHVFVAPVLVGGAAAPSAWMGAGATFMKNVMRPYAVNATKCGTDMHFHLVVQGPD